jgi:cyclopropane fatty-acyl-phospholipid synthase-like methyltransferase
MTPSDDWWTSFFVDLFGELQLTERPAEQTRSEVDALERELAMDAPLRVLDVPCGTGRHSIELARRGHRVTGIDFNRKVVERARELAASADLRVDFRQADMRELAFEAAFDRAICHWGSFGYFDDAGNADFLRRMGRALAPGGVFFLDTLVAESLYPKFRERDWSYSGEGPARRRVLEERRFDCATGRVESTWTVIGDDEQRSRDVSIRIYTYRELEALLRAAGFDRFRALDDAGAPFALGSARLWLVAGKSK